MLTTKQRAQLRALANPLADTLIIGKEGVTDAVERQLDQLLEAHELVKGKVLESAMLTPRTVSEALCEAAGPREDVLPALLAGEKAGRCPLGKGDALV